MVHKTSILAEKSYHYAKTAKQKGITVYKDGNIYNKRECHEMDVLLFSVFVLGYFVSVLNFVGQFIYLLLF